MLFISVIHFSACSTIWAAWAHLTRRHVPGQRHFVLHHTFRSTRYISKFFTRRSRRPGRSNSTAAVSRLCRRRRKFSPSSDIESPKMQDMPRRPCELARQQGRDRRSQGRGLGQRLYTLASVRVLSNWSVIVPFEPPAHDRHGISLGSTGSGQSTILSLLLRTSEFHREVRVWIISDTRIDDIRKRSKLDLCLRKHIARCRSGCFSLFSRESPSCSNIVPRGERTSRMKKISEGLLAMSKQRADHSSTSLNPGLMTE